MKKKILLVSNGFYPEISPRSYRATELAKEFCKQGHEVTIISKYRDFDYSSFLDEHKLSLKMWNKARFVKFPMWKKKPFSFLSRIITRLLLILFEYPGIEEMFLVKKNLKNEKDYHLMISFAVPYPVHWGVAWARAKNKNIADVWVADCGDPYMGDVLDSFRKLFYFKYLEKWFCRTSDYISIPIHSAIEAYYSEFHSKIRIIPQGFDFDLKEDLTSEPSNDVPTFAYAGGFLPGARDPKPLMRFLSTLDFPFKFYVFTNTPEFLDEFDIRDKVIVSNYIPRSELLPILKGMDFLINFDNNTLLNSPSKLIDYAITGRPVLNIVKDFKGDDLLMFFDKDYSKKVDLPNPENYHITSISAKFLALR